MLKIALAAILLSVPAAAWDRHTETTGPNGRTVTTDASGTCAEGSCSRDAVKTGPNGKTVSTDGSITCANGACERDVVKTGPEGGVYSKEVRTVRTEPGTVTRDLTGTGPNGRTFNRGGTFTRR